MPFDTADESRMYVNAGGLCSVPQICDSISIKQVKLKVTDAYPSVYKSYDNLWKTASKLDMATPDPSTDGERSPKRRRVSSGAPSLRGGDASNIYAQEHLPISNFDPQIGPFHSDAPQISVTQESHSEASTPRRPIPSPLEGTPPTTLRADGRRRSLMMPSAETPRSQMSSHADSDDECPVSRSSPAPLIDDGQDYQPEIGYQETMVLRGHKRGVSCVKFSPDGKWIASCSADATLKTWSASNGGHQHTFHGHLAGISTLAWSPDSLTLASGSDDKTIRLWNATTGQPPYVPNPSNPGGVKIHRAPLVAHHNYVYSVAFSPKGNMLVSSSYDEAVNVWDVRSGLLMRSLPAHGDPIGGVDFVHDGTLILSCASDGLIRVWDTATGQCLRTFFHEETPPAVSVRFTPNGKYIIAWMLDNCLRLWDYREGKCVKTYQGHVNQRYSLVGAFGSYGDGDGSGTMEAKEDGLKTDGELSPVAERPRGLKRAFLASGSEDGKIILWDVISKAILQRLHGHDGVVLAVDTHPTEKLLVSCGLDNTIRLWKENCPG